MIKHLYKYAVIMGLGLGFALALLGATQARAQSPSSSQRAVEGIAAIVNDEVISMYDVEQRVNLFFASSGIPKTEENINRLRNQVLRTLVDEKMQLQIAIESDIKISQAEIDTQILQMAQQNNGDINVITSFLKENNIRLATLESQIQADIAWRQYVRRKFGNSINISDIEIDEKLARAKESYNQTRYNLSEILLVSNEPADESRLIDLGEQLVDELKKGVDFGAVARQFSKASSAAADGKVGWVSADQLDPKLIEIVTALPKGAISAPIIASAGIYIVKVDGIQQSGGIDTDRHIYDVLIVSFDNESPTLVNDLQKIRADFKTCERTEAAVETYNIVKFNRTGPRPVGGYAQNIKSILLDLEAGEMAPTIRTPSSSEILIICERKDDQGTKVSRTQIENSIYGQRMSMMSRRQLRELRRDGVVEYR